MQSKYLYFIFLPAIIIVSIALFVRIIQYEPLYPKQVIATEQEVQTSSITLFSDDIVTGNKQAPITVVAFEDLGCAQCKVQSEFLDQIIKKYPGKINVIYKLLTVTKFPQSTKLSHDYAYCANKQNKFEEFKQIAFANSQNLSDAMLSILAKEIDLDQKKLVNCLASQETSLYSQKIEALAKSLNVQAVPALFVDNSQIRSPQSLSEWVGILEL